MEIKKEGNYKRLGKLKDVRHSNPLETVEYTVLKELNNELTFARWSPQGLHTKERIISRIKDSNNRKYRIYFGIHTSGNIKENLTVDASNKKTV